jgi:hypothetical protein
MRLNGTRQRKVWDSGNAQVTGVAVSNGVSNRNESGLLKRTYTAVAVSKAIRQLL